jgi:hypothetical protein
MEIINFIGILSITWLFATGAGSVQFIKNFFEVGSNSQPKKLWKQVAQELVNCSMCSGFWIGLAYYKSFILACIVSISAELFTRLLRLIMNKI